jgi:hypothetical protein
MTATKSGLARGLAYTVMANVGPDIHASCSGATAILGRGLIGKVTNIQVYWCQRPLPFLPSALVTIFLYVAVDRVAIPAGKEECGVSYHALRQNELGNVNDRGLNYPALEAMSNAKTSTYSLNSLIEKHKCIFIIC